MALEIGQEAPDFTLVNESNEPVTLSEQRGKPVVLVFYAFDFSGICAGELCAIRDDYSGWSDLGATVFGISRDSRFAHAAFKEKEGFTHSLLADTKGEVARLYDTWNEAMAAADRLTVVIDGAGRVVHMQKNPIPEARDHSAIADAIRSAAA